MKEKPNQHTGYRTGPTEPPKNYGSIVAILLVMVILLGGIASILGIMNIRLLGELPLEEREDAPIPFSRQSSVAETCYQEESQDAAEDTPPSLGLTAETISDFLQNYYGLPQGVYITAVKKGSHAELLGLIPGDIILTFEDTPITDTQMLTQQLHACHSGQTVNLTVYRSGNAQQVQLILDQEE